MESQLFLYVWFFLALAQYASWKECVSYERLPLAALDFRPRFASLPFLVYTLPASPQTLQGRVRHHARTFAAVLAARSGFLRPLCQTSSEHPCRGERPAQNALAL